MSLSSLPPLPRRYARTATLPTSDWFHAAHNNIQLHFQHRYGISITTLRHLRDDHDARFPNTHRGRLGSWVWLEGLDAYGARLCREQAELDEHTRVWQAYERRKRRREERRVERSEREMEEGECVEGEMGVVEEERLEGDGDVVMGGSEREENVSEGQASRGDVCTG